MAKASKKGMLSDEESMSLAAALDCGSMLDFIRKSYSPYHAVRNFQEKLVEDGFTELRLGEKWQVKKGGSYYVTYNGTSIMAFRLNDDAIDKGLRIVASHSDSPTFRIKPNGMTFSGSMVKLTTETYGGAILYSWLDRPLALAGRAIFKGSDPLHPESRLVESSHVVGVIPSVAIHFNRGVNEGVGFNKQVDMQILAATGMDASGTDFKKELCGALNVDPKNLLDYDLYAFDPLVGCIAGLDQSLIISSRLDNLSMAYESYDAFISASGSKNSMMWVMLDNEEVGSGTKQGAASSLVRDVLERAVKALWKEDDAFMRMTYNSFLVSADMAHALHPNHPELADGTNRPVLNGGPVIKYNANQKYMTDADGAAVFKLACERAGVPYQTFVNRSDMAGGSTLGNIMTGHLPLRGVDVGNPLLAMHSCVETGGVFDGIYMSKALQAFYEM